MPGGTWTILVEEGVTEKRTQSTIVAKRERTTKPKVSSSSNNEISRKGIRLAQTGIVIGAGVTKIAFNQYYSITGQNARNNEIGAKLTYGAAVASIGLQLAKGNTFGASVATIGTVISLSNQYFNFQKDIAEQNATAEYLRRQSNTSINTEGELYKFRLF
jgi:hypothetical protein